MKEYKIGELSAITGVKSGTIRFYEKHGFIETIFLPVKRRLPNPEKYDPNERVMNISLDKIERDNPILCEYNIPLSEISPVNNPHYKVLETGEAEFIGWIARKLSTNVSVRIFLVDIEFMVTVSEGFGYGSDEGSIRFYHRTTCLQSIWRISDSRLSKAAICFHQPILVIITAI